MLIMRQKSMITGTQSGLMMVGVAADAVYISCVFCDICFTTRSHYYIIFRGNICPQNT